MHETRTRSVLKALSWRATGTSATFVVTYLVTAEFYVAGSIAAIQLLTNTLLYIVHERAWDKVDWGRL